MEVLVLVAVLWMVIAAVVAVHARESGRSWAVWGTLTFFLGVFALIGYLALLVTGESDAGGTVRVCPSCGTRHEDTPLYCSECGEEFATGGDGSRHDATTASIIRSGARAYCDNCMTRTSLEAERCDGCGAVF